MAHKERPRAFGAEKPLMTAGAVAVATEGAKIDRDAAGTLRSVKVKDDVPLPAYPTQFEIVCRPQHPTVVSGDVAHADHAGPLGKQLADFLNELSARGQVRLPNDDAESIAKVVRGENIWPGAPGC